MTPEEQKTLATYWYPQYILGAQLAHPDQTAGQDLAVGWKLTSPTGKTYGGYYWPLVDGDHDEPVLHVATAWDTRNQKSCPAVKGDGLCVALTVAAAQSGGLRFGASVGHVLVYPKNLARSDTPGKLRVPWVIDVDCFGPCYLNGANLNGANLTGANLTGAVGR